MNILHLSDTHGCHRRLTNLPVADVAVHSGDFTMAGSESEALDFMEWFCDLPYAHKIFICGNHDDCLYGAEISGLDDNVHYLCHSGIEIFGVKFYGVPMFMSDRQRNIYESIPDGIDVLITHAPPYGVLDFDDNTHYGSEALLRRIVSVAPRLHLFGHIHHQHGMTEIGATRFSNGAIMNADYTTFFSPNCISL